MPSQHFTRQAVGQSAMTLAMALLATPAITQGSREPQAVPSWARGSDVRCPTGWTLRGATCHANGPSSPRIIPRESRSSACPTGYGSWYGMPFCIEGEDSRLARDASGSVSKANRLDRCPIGYFTNIQAPDTCITNIQNPPTVRLRGGSACRAGEVEDWGLYCVSNYAGVSRGAATGNATRDWNAIYSTNNATPPRQADTPEGTEYTPAYLVIFGRVQADGSPIGGAATTAAAQPAATSAPASTAARDTRVGSMNPQRRTATALGLCPTYWVPGQPGSDLPDPNMCYPAPQATAIFPVGGVNDPCPDGYMNSVGWCMVATPAAQTAATQASAATTTTQPGVNCPPAANNQQAAQAGAALGGLLGGRRGNSQAGAAVGGMLGQAVGGAAQRPPGCP